MLSYTAVNDGARTVLVVRGALAGTEATVLGEMVKRLAGRPAAFHLNDLTAMNTRGIAEWSGFVGRLVSAYTYVDCPVHFIDCINLFSEAHGKGVVTSFFAPMRCPSCSKCQDVRLEASKVDVAAGFGRMNVPVAGISSSPRSRRKNI